MRRWLVFMAAALAVCGASFGGEARAQTVQEAYDRFKQSDRHSALAANRIGGWAACTGHSSPYRAEYCARQACETSRGSSGLPCTVLSVNGLDEQDVDVQRFLDPTLRLPVTVRLGDAAPASGTLILELRSGQGALMADSVGVRCPFSVVGVSPDLSLDVRGRCLEKDIEFVNRAAFSGVYESGGGQGAPAYRGVWRGEEGAEVSFEPLL